MRQAAHLAHQAVVGEANPTWAATLERIASSVVSINVDEVRSFDTDWNETAQATGFVVDAKRGIILTNRHVVTPGPVTAEAVFLDREVVQLYPIYRDPVHDFGFYHYDPTKLHYIQPKPLALYPQGAEVGREIRVVGNNAGEQLSILAGTLARLDREAPDYGFGKYNDFNTFYLQAASGTSGGSSGSPVIDIQGRVVALNAGGADNSASSFYLPLERVRRALKLIQRGQPVTRGTIYTVFGYTPYDELERLGLPLDIEAAVRRQFPQRTGMLAVASVLPGTPSALALQPGDILLRINGRYVTTFDPVEETLDSSVGRQIRLDVERGGRAVSVTLPVGDLTAITPSSYVQFGDAVVNTLSYQEARQLNVPPRGVFVANPGYVFGAAGIPRGAVISQLNSTPIDDLADFRRALAGLGNGDYANVRFTTVEDTNGSELGSFRMDRLWYPDGQCVRDDALGTWPCTPLGPGPQPKPDPVSSTGFPKYKDPRLTALAPSLATVTFNMPYSVSGVTEHFYHGTGLIVDAQRGLVVVDRDTVPVSLGDVTVTFAGTAQVPGRVVYVDPVHDFSIVAYDPRLIGTTPVKAATLKPEKLTPGEPIWVVGLGDDSQMHARATEIASIDPLSLPLSRTMRFRDTNIETIGLVNPPSDFDGVLTDASGNVLGTWSSFAYDSDNSIAQALRGVPIDVVADMVDRVRSGQPLHSLDVELDPEPLASARQMGLSADWASKLAAHSPTEREALTVIRTVGGSPASSLLQPGDLVLALDGKVVTEFREVEQATADRAEVQVTVWRGGAEQTLTVPTASLSGAELERVVQWAGATLQAPFQAMRAQRGIVPVGVYVDYFAYGSPAARYGLYPGRRIVQVDGQPTPDLDAFIRAVAGRADRSSLRLTTITWNNAASVITLKLDKHYWPAYQLLRTPDGWKRQSLE
ncbi:MAG TPA: trypsin-like peptidase domain-containing protein [Steroidobacteraceae bacterium]|jgi:S1-C subfamily serine protease|nr:trypsin-like peptidase domain-containing protein [Steroidobacteraceae bacterium]